MRKKSALLRDPEADRICTQYLGTLMGRVDKILESTQARYVRLDLENPLQFYDSSGEQMYKNLDIDRLAYWCDKWTEYGVFRRLRNVYFVTGGLDVLRDAVMNRTKNKA